ncbi:3'-5' exonuclease [Seongchinamella unica]|uniref:3'-5' exonuclease n=1 Tax=Seongchinamella unica TaxID=2547392 RepID=A0A4R5LPE8_9GAMM|nr:exonuclease domain-containing protein [Seongchinamella unica]TDG12131.1 3'-5' exonuclease [Seongchinamella unica]
MWRLQLRRLPYRKRIAGTALQACWHAPLPSTSSDWREVSFLVVDAEMSSLDASTGELLSVGWVVVQQGSISLASAEHHLIRAENSVGQSATIHNLRDHDLVDAREREQVLEHFLEVAAGKVLVFHNAVLDLAFLNKICRRYFHAPLLMPVVDTLLQEESLLRRREQAIKTGELRLQACRDRYNLPRFHGHNALLDALATAELLIAMASHRAAGKQLPLRQLL